MMVAGIVLWGASAALTGVGTGQFLANGFCSVAVQDGGTLGPKAAGHRERIGVAREAICSDTLSTAGFGMILAGQITSVIAIPIFVVGNARVPLGRGMAWRRPEVYAGARELGLRVRF
jgi:hypothetical protein